LAVRFWEVLEGMSMAKAETRHITSDRLVGDIGGTVTRTMRSTGERNISGQQEMTAKMDLWVNS
jgi:hypothetical protein